MNRYSRRLPPSRYSLLLLPLLLGVPGPAAAQLRLAPVISDGMVMQRHATVPVWGWTEREDTVVVTFDGQTYNAAADTSGRWTVTLPPRAAGGPYEMVVADKRARLQVRDILIGDVWLAAGQSNMRHLVRLSRNAAQEIAAANDLRIRHFKIPHSWEKDAPLSEPAAELTGGAWAVADSAHVGHFTGVGYFFARELRKSVDVPIGLIDASAGSATIVQWMSREALRLETGVTSYPGYAPGNNKGNRIPTQLYNKMVHPLLRYPIKGILWYQGETEAASGAGIAGSDIHVKYRELLPTMIADWRRAWGLGDLPFLFVQLPSFVQSYRNGRSPNNSWAVLRESQSAALRLPNTAQAVTVDLGEADKLHPTNKQDVGARLALAARRVAYGEQVEYSGPQYRRHAIRAGRIILEFDHIGQGLAAGRDGGELQGFVIAGADRQFVPARATIDGGRVVVWSDRVPHPVAVRYAWANNPDGANLYNRNGLPAAPFRTDEWPHE